MHRTTQNIPISLCVYINVSKPTHNTYDKLQKFFFMKQKVFHGSVSDCYISFLVLDVLCLN